MCLCSSSIPKEIAGVIEGEEIIPDPQITARLRVGYIIEEEKCRSERKTLLELDGIYEGEVQYNEKHGLGCFLWYNGNFYNGNWSNDYIQGEGEFLFASGKILRGNFIRGKLCGVGKCIENNGTVSMGVWKDQKLHGNALIVKRKKWFLVEYKLGNLIKILKKGMGSLPIIPSLEFLQKICQQQIYSNKIIIIWNTIKLNKKEENKSNQQKNRNKKQQQKEIEIKNNKKKYKQKTTTTTTTKKYQKKNKTTIKINNRSLKKRYDRIGQKLIWLNNKIIRQNILAIEQSEGYIIILHAQRQHSFCENYQQHFNIIFSLQHDLNRLLWEDKICFHEYQGQISEGKREGNGHYKFPNGTRYLGTWRRNKPNGLGLFLFEDNKFDAGIYENGFLNGYGIMQYHCGDVYEGYFKGGKMEGLGLFYYKADHTCTFGFWEKNKLRLQKNKYKGVSQGDLNFRTMEKAHIQTFVRLYVPSKLDQTFGSDQNLPTDSENDCSNIPQDISESTTLAKSNIINFSIPVQSAHPSSRMGRELCTIFQKIGSKFLIQLN